LGWQVTPLLLAHAVQSAGELGSTQSAEPPPPELEELEPEEELDEPELELLEVEDPPVDPDELELSEPELELVEPELDELEVEPVPASEWFWLSAGSPSP